MLRLSLLTNHVSFIHPSKLKIPPQYYIEMLFMEEVLMMYIVPFTAQRLALFDATLQLQGTGSQRWQRAR